MELIIKFDRLRSENYSGMLPCEVNVSRMVEAYIRWTNQFPSSPSVERGDDSSFVSLGKCVVHKNVDRLHWRNLCPPSFRRRGELHLPKVGVISFPGRVRQILR